MNISLQELKAMAQDANVQGWDKLQKDELLNALYSNRKYAMILDYMEDYGISLEEAADMARR